MAYQTFPVVRTLKGNNLFDSPLSSDLISGIDPDTGAHGEFNRSRLESVANQPGASGAAWFRARYNRPAGPGEQDKYYTIYWPTDKNGNPITFNPTTLVAAPCPPFCQDDTI